MRLPYIYPNMKKSIGGFSLATVFVLSTQTQAALILNFTEITGGGVSYAATGSLNFGGMQASATGILISTLETAGINPAAGSFVSTGFGSISLPTANKYTGITGPTSFGSGSKTDGPSFGVGFWFYPSAGELYIGSSYVSGTPLASISGFYSGKTLGALGLTPGTYTWTLGTGPQSDTLTMNVVPEPSSFALLGFAAAGLLVRRKR
jgi:hypothetical protein